MANTILNHFVYSVNLLAKGMSIAASQCSDEIIMMPTDTGISLLEHQTK